MPVVYSVIVVEDDMQYRETLVRYLELSGFDAVGVSSAVEFYEAVHSRTFALAVLDLGLPDQSGLVLAEYLRRNTSMRVVILTGRSALNDRIAGYEAGADLYLQKSVAFEELSAALHSLCRRRQGDHGEEPEPTWRLVMGQWLLVAPGGEHLRLSAREFQFLSCLAEHPKAIVSREHIRGVLGYDSTPQGYKAMEALVYRLRKKIPSSFGEAIRTASAHGYSFAFPIELS